MYTPTLFDATNTYINHGGEGRRQGQGHIGVDQAKFEKSWQVQIELARATCIVSFDHNALNHQQDPENFIIGKFRNPTDYFDTNNKLEFHHYTRGGENEIGK